MQGKDSTRLQCHPTPARMRRHPKTWPGGLIRCSGRPPGCRWAGPGRISGPREAWTPSQPPGLCAVFTAGTSVRLGQHDGNRRKSPGGRGAFFHNLIGCLVPGERWTPRPAQPWAPWWQWRRCLTAAEATQASAGLRYDARGFRRRGRGKGPLWGRPRDWSPQTDPVSGK